MGLVFEAVSLKLEKFISSISTDLNILHHLLISSNLWWASHTLRVQPFSRHRENDIEHPNSTKQFRTE